MITRKKELQERERGREKKKEKEMPTIVRRACFIQGNVLNRNKCGQFYSAEFTHSQGYIMHNGGDSTRGIHSSIRWNWGYTINKRFLPLFCATLHLLLLLHFSWFTSICFSCLRFPSVIFDRANSSDHASYIRFASSPINRTLPCLPGK